MVVVVRVLEPGPASAALLPATAVVEGAAPCPLAVLVLLVCRVLSADADADARMTELSSWLSM